MNHILHLINDRNLIQDCKNQFKKDIKFGLENIHKKIPSEYLYDEVGSDLFNKITKHPDYYLTNSELFILNKYKSYFSTLMDKTPFNLIELGPGEGIKPQILINQFLSDLRDFIYIPIDISAKYLEELSTQFENKFSDLNITALHTDFFKGLEWLNKNLTRRNFVLFLGSSIGNFDPVKTQSFLKHLWESLQNNDYVLLGFDLCKDVNMLLSAYDDNAGITRDFNLNLLNRINRELDANFNLEKFKHYATYNVKTDAMESYLISQVEQVVHIKALQQSIRFESIEAIHIECSYKYRIRQIEEYAAENGFKIIKHFTDPNHYFLDTLWQVVKKNV